MLAGCVAEGIVLGRQPLDLLEDGASCGVRKLGSSGEAVFVDESAESVSACDGGCWQVQDSQLPGRRIGRFEVE